MNTKQSSKTDLGIAPSKRKASDYNSMQVKGWQERAKRQKAVTDSGTAPSVSKLTLAEQNHLIIEYGFEKAVVAEAWFNESHSVDFAAGVYAVPYIKANEYLWA